MAEVVEVEVKSAWYSKINWANVANIAFLVAATFGLNIPDDTKVQLIAGVSAIVSFMTIIMKTFFTPTVTPASAAKV
ncbi:MAG: hypothetical protein WC026_17385 [Hyphomicrobium sp.]|uniref:hypothetical protein n=1 Tax=Hyphomicrobium sp. TaxID=82 RepID=UPI0035631202